MVERRGQKDCFFHASVKERQAKQTSFRLNLDDGSSTSDPSLIGTKACESFSSMFKAGHGNPSSTLLNCISSLVTPCMNENLCGIPTENEIWEAVSKLDPDSAPGLDGFNGHFFISCWSIYYQI